MEDRSVREDEALFAKIAWRIIPFMGLLYFVSFLDRVNVGFAALTMNRDLGFTADVFGFGAGIFFLGYFLFEVPSNVVLTKVGARLWICRIMLTWGAVSMAMAFVWNPLSFYVMRFLLGLAEAGFAPAMLYYLTFWFPPAIRTRYMAAYFLAIPMASVIGAPVSGLILEMDGLGGLRGWQWLFLIEGLPALILAFVVLVYLPDGPKTSRWLSDHEKQRLLARLAAEDASSAGSGARHELWPALRDWRVLAMCAVYFGIVIGLYGCTLWLPQIVSAMGYSNQQTGFVVGGVYVVVVVAMMAVARSSEVRRERIWHVVVPALFAAACLIAAALTGSSLIALAMLTLATSAIYATLSPFWVVPPSFLAGTGAAAGMALINATGNLGGYVGPMVIGALRQSTGAFAPGLLVLAAAAVFAAIIMLLISRGVQPRPRN